ncbi:MAG: hypothetical protein P4L46_14365 [Fimbriimonas sp.]|nr:hypothetical protein [Fimbriimonas sp.]
MNAEYIGRVNQLSRIGCRTISWLAGARSHLLLSCLICSCVVTPFAAFGQVGIPVPMPRVDVPPPAISFAPWRQVDQTDEVTEFVEEFPSTVVTAYPENNVVPLRVFVPANVSGPIPIVLVLHYWGATDIRNERALAQELTRAHIATAVMTLPYHLARTPPGHRSGDMAIQPDPASLVSTMTQAVLDARRSLDFLDTRPEFDHSRVGIAGTSLGAVVAELAYAVDSRVTKATFILGGVNLAHIVWSSSLLVQQRDLLRRKGYTEEKLSEAIKSIEPLEYFSTRKPTSSFVIAGLYDTVIPKQSAEELIESLSSPKVLWLDTGHYGGIFVQRRLMREVGKYFQIEFRGATFAAPKNLYAPTIRLGVKVDTGNGFDIGVGLDLIKFDKRGDGFTSLFLTPRGPQLFVGKTIYPAVSVGVIGSTHSVGIGLLWSAVL